MPRSHPAATRPQPTAASPTGPHPAANGGFCTIRRIATACRRRVAPLMVQFPPFARAGTTATPSSAPPSPLARASNATPPQPRPRPPPATDHPATPRRERRQQRVWPQPTRPPRQLHRATPGRLPARPPLSGPHPAAQRGFCTIRCIATACRRRVAPLMLQFPPHTTPATAPTATSDGSPGHGLGPASRPPPPAETSCSTSYSDKEKSNQFTSFKLSQTNV